MYRSVMVIIKIIVFLLCSVSSQVRAMDSMSPLDPSSFSRPELAVIKHISLSLDVNFVEKVLSGVATLNFEILDDVNEVILDTSKLTIKSVEFDDGEPLKYHIGEEVPNFGSKLTIKLDKVAHNGDKEIPEVPDTWHAPTSVASKLKLTRRVGIEEDGHIYIIGSEGAPQVVTTVDDLENIPHDSELDLAGGPGNVDQIYSMPTVVDADLVSGIPVSDLDQLATTDAPTSVASKLQLTGSKVGIEEDGHIYNIGSEGAPQVVTTVDDLENIPHDSEPDLAGGPGNVDQIYSMPTVVDADLVSGVPVSNLDQLATTYAPTSVASKLKLTRSKVGIEEDGQIYIIGSDGAPQVVTTVDDLENIPHDSEPGLAGNVDQIYSMPTVVDANLVSRVPVSDQLATTDFLIALATTELLTATPKRPVPPKHNLATTPVAGGKHRSIITIKIKYSTSPNASALQWLEPSQTSGKTLPYLFSQCQPIHARSIIPCQDTPAVKFTYDAEVTAPSQFVVLMSALRGDVQGNKTSFKQPMPLPSYLLAIAVGELESRYLGPRSRVWCEKAELTKSAWEFCETEKYLAAAEKICGKYEWTEYDLLVLPPSFPYGGMENPCLTFVTPTLLAGDRSQADVIIHEIMHSWTGNLVTNRNFEHFWLNEGFTVFLERKVAASLIADPVEAKKSRDFHSLLGLQELNETINHLGVYNPLTKLVPDLKGVHPDDAFSRVPYEKGSLFLRHLEDLAGGPEVFDEFLRSYLNHFRKKSLDSNDFKSYLYSYFKDNEKLKEVRWDDWLYMSGMPIIIPDYDTSMTKSVTSLVDRITVNSTFSESDIASFTPHQVIYLLQKLLEGPRLPLYAFKSMETTYKLVGNKNSEIRFRWLRMAIKQEDKDRLKDVFEFVNSQGRMKYVRPIYRDLYAWWHARDIAIKNFLENEKYMMHVSAYTLRKDLHLDD